MARINSYKFEITGELVINAPTQEAAELYLSQFFNTGKEFFNITATAKEISQNEVLNMDMAEQYEVKWK
jgi:hypothetical protein